MPVRLAMIGLSHSHSHGNAQAAAMVDDVDLVGMWDPQSQLAWRRGSEWADYHPGLTIYPTLEAALDDGVDGVIVEGPPHENVQLARTALERGKHVLLEKPAGPELAAFRSLQELARERGLLVQLGYIMRYNPGFELIQRLKASGALGDVFSVRGRISWERASYDGHMPEIGVRPGGMLYELGCHLLDLIIALLGKPDRAQGYFGRHNDPGRRYTDNVVACLEYANAFATIDTTAMEIGALQNRCFEVYGTRGTVIIQPLEPPEVVVNLEEPSGEFRAGWQSARIQKLPRHVRDLEEFAACIRGVKSPNYSFEHDLAVHETLLEMCATDTDD